MSELFNPKDIRGGQVLRKIPVIPYDLYVEFGLKVAKGGKIIGVRLDPVAMTADESFQLCRFLIATGHQHPGPVNWDTVPEQIARHFVEIPQNPVLTA